MLRFSSLAVLVAALCCSQAAAQVTLEIKYPPETKSVSETTVKSNQTLTLAGMDIETKSSTFSTISKTIGKRDEEGLLPVVEKVDVLQTDIDLPGGTTIKFDSANPDAKADNPLLEPLMERLRVTYKTPVTVLLDSKNNIQDVKLPAGVAEGLDPANKSLFDPVKRKKAAEQARGYLPDEPVKPGEKWERATEIDLGSGQTMSFRTTYTYDGTVDHEGQKVDKITGKVFEVSYSVDATNSTLSVSKSDLKVTESSETVLFNRDLGQVIQKTAKVRVAGPLTLVIGGTELEGKVDLTIEESTKRQK